MASTTLKLFHSGSGPVLVRVFAGTPREVLLEGVREALGVPPGAPLRFRDEDGAICVVWSGMPSTVLLVAVEEGLPQDALRVVQPVTTVPIPGPDTTPVLTDWRSWAAVSSNATLAMGGKLFMNPKGDAAWALSPELPASGRHYIALDARGKQGRPCCVSIGLVPTSRVSMPSDIRNTDRIEWPWMVWLKTLTPDARGSGESEPGVVGIMVDMDERTATFGEEGAAEPTTTVWRLPARVKLSISVPKHSLTVRFMGRTEPVWAGDGASEDEDEDEDEDKDDADQEEQPAEDDQDKGEAAESSDTTKTGAGADTASVPRWSAAPAGRKREGSEPAGPPTKKSK
jgi:hypothetical protein